ncbi:helix-turn-helix transcriptional regulator [Mycobacterium koreense]|uniref:Uncharacterized protein n=1 Tax=Mycolicibacillus koreensis TaxID=1069220 RepID=A0A7I7SD68_9MYCO|nr:helix-turn-helix transcriptional regulator [Mycolicibacillus koreensis]MCV7247670.1 helix-turn-helix transcriptional regulator [Mycolicibacillus koreensis]OSC34790.1 hypothetical protein B8W67_05955 [Mycolicibacillus koreensis]BBY54056.1 hypothetical protein MKOR_13070 [Mycolicibacillus koreensis]
MSRYPQRTYEITDETVGEVLNSARLGVSLSVRDVAKIADIDYRVLSRIERGDRPCRVAEMVELARAYDIKPEVMLLAICGQKKAKAEVKRKRMLKGT